MAPVLHGLIPPQRSKVKLVSRLLSLILMYARTPLQGNTEEKRVRDASRVRHTPPRLPLDKTDHTGLVCKASKRRAAIERCDGNFVYL